MWNTVKNSRKKCSVHKVKRNKVGGRGDFDSPAIACKNVPYKSCRPGEKPVLLKVSLCRLRFDIQLFMLQ